MNRTELKKIVAEIEKQLKTGTSHSEILIDGFNYEVCTESGESTEYTINCKFDGKITKKDLNNGKENIYYEEKYYTQNKVLDYIYIYVYEYEEKYVIDVIIPVFCYHRNMAYDGTNYVCIITKDVEK